MKFIWATRGHTWGFKFLSRGGYADPLPVYERAFSAVGDEAEVCLSVGVDVALRFEDPEGRRDRAGRVILHEFVVLGPLTEPIYTVDDGLRLVWTAPNVAQWYERVWAQPEPPDVDGR